MKNYMLHLWGAGQEQVLKENPECKEHEGSLYYYFEKEQEMDKFISGIRKYFHGCLSVPEGDVHNRTVACMDLIHQGNTYYHEKDFGYGYPADSAEFMYFEGNYSCDCNKIIFLSREYSELEHLKECPCADTIEIKNFRIEYRS